MCVFFERRGAVFTAQVDARCAGELPHVCAATAPSRAARNLVRESLVGFSAKSVSSAALRCQRETFITELGEGLSIYTVYWNYY